MGVCMKETGQLKRRTQNKTYVGKASFALPHDERTHYYLHRPTLTIYMVHTKKTKKLTIYTI